ncbi:MAG: MMPL family transporter [Cyanobacteriota bacterium]
MKRIAKIIVEKNKFILLFFSFLVILSIILLWAFPADNVETEIHGRKEGEAYRVKEILNTEFDIKLGSSGAIVIKGKQNTQEIKDKIEKQFKPYLNRIIDFTNDEHKNTMIFIDFDKNKTFGETQNLTPQIREIISTWAKKNNTECFYTGNNALQYDARVSSKNDSKTADIFALLIAFIILIFTFGSIVSALLPIISAIMTLLFFVTIVRVTGMSNNYISQIIASLTGLALATDYSLFIISRFKEEIENGDDFYAIYETLLNSGKTIFYSGLIMICSVSSLYIPDISITKSVVINMSLVISISIINSIFFLPSLALLLKNHLDKPKFLSKLIDHNKQEAFWEKFTSHIVKYPKIYFISSSLLLISLALPVLNIKLFSPVINVAPSNAESIKGYEALNADGWGGQIVPINLIIKSDKSNSVYSVDFLSEIYDLTEKLKKHPKVSGVQSLTSWNKDFSKNDYISFYNSLGVFLPQNNPLINHKGARNMTVMNVFPKDLLDLSNSFEIISYIKKETENSKYQVLTGGLVSRVKDLTSELYGYIPQMLAIIFVGIYILIFIHIKSIVIPIKAFIMNFLPILASFGLLTLVFQYGWFSSILNTPVNNAVTNIVPITLFCIVFGLSMDYEILILSRITEEYHKTKNVEKSIIKGLSKSGSLITGASFILIGVFMVGCVSPLPQVKEICLGMVSAIIIDATIVRIIMVPSFMMLMGELNWISFKKD